MASPTLTFTQSHNIADYRPLIDDLTNELGQRFGRSMENWCGIGERPYPLPTWQVYLAHDPSGAALGVCSYYQQVDDPPERYWVGWIGVRLTHRRQGIARTMFQHIRTEVERHQAHQLWVYTDSIEAEQFYRAMGMHNAGQFGETGLEQAAADGDEAVLVMQL